MAITTATLAPSSSPFTVFDKDLLQKQANIPEQFVWPAEELVKTSPEELNEPLIDLAVLKNGDEAAIANAAELVRKACMKHGFFQVTNHGVDPDLLNAAYEGVDSIFSLPLSKKLSAKKKPDSQEGYAGAHGDRFASRLPWKETLTFTLDGNKESETTQVVDYFNSAFGEELQHTGLVYQKYCEAMKELSLPILELLAVSLGVDRLHYQKFFEDGIYVMRCNSYPACINSNLTLGTGPHSDPTSLTFLHQDQVGGLEVFVDNKWLAVRPRPDAFVINIGDTFMALTNGIYKSCLHRVLVNPETERKSLSCFLNPRGDKKVIPPHNLFGNDAPRKYPDFIWSDLLEFTQKHHRADADTLKAFISWIQSSQLSN